MRPNALFWTISTAALLAVLVTLALVQSVPPRLRTKTLLTDSSLETPLNKNAPPLAKEAAPSEGACYLRHPSAIPEGKAYTTCSVISEKDCSKGFNAISEIFNKKNRERGDKLSDVKTTDDDPLDWWLERKACPAVDTASLRLLDPGVLTIGKTRQATEKACLETLNKKRILCPEGSRNGGVAEGPAIVSSEKIDDSDSFTAYCKIVKYCK